MTIAGSQISAALCDFKRKNKAEEEKERLIMIQLTVKNKHDFSNEEVILTYLFVCFRASAVQMNMLYCMCRCMQGWTGCIKEG